MLGFYAEALTEEITIDPHETASMPAGSPATRCATPTSTASACRALDSIARRLIEDWIAAT